jgi:hypothetical protein
MRSTLFKRRLEQVNITKSNFVLRILWMLSVDFSSEKCLNLTGLVLSYGIKLKSMVCH